MSSPRVTFSSSTGRRSRTGPGSHRLRLVMVCGCLLRTQQCVELVFFWFCASLFFCLVRVFVGEFDPGSGRTLAACLTHASRTVRPFWGYTSGERVSNTWVTCPALWDKPGKLGLIPDRTLGCMVESGKLFVVWYEPAAYQLVGGVMAYQGCDG